jgi:death-on-curing family protein
MPYVGEDERDEREVMIKKSALLLHSIVRGHVFTDGNKRTGFVAMATFLRKNGWGSTPLSVEELVRDGDTCN